MSKKDTYLQKIKRFYRLLGLRGVIMAFKAKLFSTSMLAEVKRGDTVFPFHLRIPSSDLETYEQVFFNPDYKFKMAKQPKVIVDAGANIGLASILFANMFPQAKIISIEPQVSNFEMLKKNVEQYKNIIPVQAALWWEVSEINLVDPGLGQWGFMTESVGSSDAQIFHKVKAVTVESLLSKYHLEKIDLFKMDIEGAEKEVLQNTLAWIGRVNVLIVELHDRIKDGCSRSYYNGTNGFDQEWSQGENMYLSRKGWISR